MVELNKGPAEANLQPGRELSPHVNSSWKTKVEFKNIIYVREGWGKETICLFKIDDEDFGNTKTNYNIQNTVILKN